MQGAFFIPIFKEVIEIDQLTLRLSNGKSDLVMNKGSGVRLIAVSGLDASPYTVLTSETAQTDGVVCDGVRINPRPVTIAADIADLKQSGFYRRRVQSFFNPKLTGDLVVNRNGTERRIHYKVEALDFTDAGSTQFTVGLLCPEPLFMHMSNFGKNIASITPQFTFNYLFTRWKGQIGHIMGYKTLKKRVLLNNSGDTGTGLTAEFVAKRGAVTNPVLHNESGAYVRVMIDMAKGDKMVINTKERHKSIRLNGENIMHRMDRRSTFFQLDMGENYISYDAEENYSNLDVYIYYTPVYLGV